MIRRLTGWIYAHQHRLWLAVGIAVLTIWLFWPATGYEFLNFDDDRYVSDNPHVYTGLSPTNIRWAFTTVHEDWWLPVLWISYMVDTEIWDTGPFGYHLTNALLHSLNAVLLFLLLTRMTGSVWRSAFAAALFAIHPLRAESVAWIAARKDVLSGMFFLLGLMAYLRHTRRPSRPAYLMLFCLMLLGLMSKAILIILPFTLLLLDFWPLRRAQTIWGRQAWMQWRPLLLEKTPLFILSLIFILFNLRTHRTGGPEYTWLAPLDRLALVFPNYWDYLRQIFWPFRISIFHPENDVVHWPASLFALAGLVAISLLFLRLRGRHPYLITGWLWFLLALFPVIRGIRFGLVAYADRFTYLPSIGLGFALTWLVADVFPCRQRHGPWLAGLALAILLFCGGRTRAVLPFWKDSVSTFGNAMIEASEHGLVLNNYAEALVSARRVPEALEYFEKAVANSRGITSFISNIGIALVLLNRPDEAILRMENARLKHKPACEFLNFAVGMAWMEKNEPAKAIPYFQTAVNGPLARPIWRVELARALRAGGQTRAFSNEMARAASEGSFLSPDFDGLCIYYLRLWQSGHGRRAWTFFQHALEEYPDNAPMLNNVAWFLATDPPAGVEPGKALEMALKARDLNTNNHPGILDTLAVAYAADGQFDRALHWAELARNEAVSNGMTALAAQIEEHRQYFETGKAWGRNDPVKR